MRKNAKSTAQSNRAPLMPTTEQWHTADTAITALRAAFAPLLQPLTESERRELLRVGVFSEAFTADYAALIATESDLVPATLRPADTARDWQTRAELEERRQALLTLVQQIADTMAALQNDCYASALIAYRFLTQGGLPPGQDAAVEPLREHWARRQERYNQTRAANLALEAAKQVSGGSSGGSTGGGNAAAPTPNAATAVTPMSATNGASATAPRNGNGTTDLAA